MDQGLVLPLVHLLVTGVSVLLVSKVLPGMEVRSYGSAVLFAVVVAILNTLAWHFLGVMTFPFAGLSFGLGALVVNGLVFLAADKVVSGVKLSGCLTAILASIGVTLVNGLLEVFLGKWAP
jgi:putative membrane protein